VSYRNIVRAWKDPEYRLGLSAAEQARLPENPAGTVELTDDELNAAAGGTSVVTDDCYATGGFVCTGQP
jgi:mersacidin/lichenicidin family type 2 lantibiotic